MTGSELFRFSLSNIAEHIEIQYIVLQSYTKNKDKTIELGEQTKTQAIIQFPDSEIGLHLYWYLGLNATVGVSASLNIKMWRL